MAVRNEGPRIRERGEARPDRLPGRDDRATRSTYNPLPFPPLPILAIRADPAVVEPANKPADSPSVARFRRHRLLYLGQSGGTLVLYDATTEAAVYLLTSSIILRIGNCHADPPPAETRLKAENY